MNLTLISKSKADVEFCKTVIDILQQYCHEKLDESKCKLFDKDILKFTDMSAWKVIVQGFKNLKVTTFGKSAVISINPEVKTEKGYSIDNICTLINDGNLTNSQYDIFDQAFNYVKNNIEVIYYLYVLRSQEII